MKCFLSKEFSLALTGYNGFIASQFVRRYKANDWAECDLDGLPSGTVLFHLAAKASLGESGFDVIENNVALDLSVAKAVDALQLRLIYFSTNNVYPNKIDSLISDAQLNLEAYSKSKYVGEKIAQCLDDKKYAILRLADVFGAGQRHGAFFKAIEVSLMEKKPIALYGRGQKLRSYIYIDELVSVMEHMRLLSLDNGLRGQVYNVCHQEALSIYDLVSFFSASEGLDVVEKNYPADRERNDIRTMLPSTIEGYQYKYSLQGALVKYIQDCKA